MQPDKMMIPMIPITITVSPQKNLTKTNCEGGCFIFLDSTDVKYLKTSKSYMGQILIFLTLFDLIEILIEKLIFDFD